MKSNTALDPGSLAIRYRFSFQDHWDLFTGVRAIKGEFRKDPPPMRPVCQGQTSVGPFTKVIDETGYFTVRFARVL